MKKRVQYFLLPIYLLFLMSTGAYSQEDISRQEPSVHPQTIYTLPALAHSSEHHTFSSGDQPILRAGDLPGDISNEFEMPVSESWGLLVLLSIAYGLWARKKLKRINRRSSN